MTSPRGAGPGPGPAGARPALAGYTNRESFRAGAGAEPRVTRVHFDFI